MDNWKVFGGCLLIVIAVIGVLGTLIYGNNYAISGGGFNDPQVQDLVNQLMEISVIWLILGIVGGLFIGAGIYGGKPTREIPPPKT